MTDPTALVVALAVWCASGMIGAACGSSRGRGAAGFMLGLFLGPLGWVVALLLPSAYVGGPRRGPYIRRRRR